MNLCDLGKLWQFQLSFQIQSKFLYHVKLSKLKGGPVSNDFDTYWFVKSLYRNAKEKMRTLNFSNHSIIFKNPLQILIGKPFYQFSVPLNLIFSHFSELKFSLRFEMTIQSLHLVVVIREFVYGTSNHRQSSENVTATWPKSTLYATTTNSPFQLQLQMIAYHPFSIFLFLFLRHFVYGI